MTQKSWLLLIVLVHHCISSDVHFATFSAATDWHSEETLHQLSFTVEKYGFAFFKMTENDKDLYKLAYPAILSFFRSTSNCTSKYLPDQDLNFSIWREQDIFYGYVNYQTIKPYQQCRCFMIPVQNNEIMNHPSNPWKDNENVWKFANSIINHSLKVLYHIIGYILEQKMKFSNICIDIDKYFDELLGKNPSTHIGINYFNSNELNKNIKCGMVEHTDAGFLSMFVLNSRGLQIQYDNQWIDIDYYPNKFIINLGAMLELLTNGIVKAIRHKVKTIENGERLSFGIFLNADIEGNVYRLLQNNTLKPIKTVLQQFQDAFQEYLSDTSTEQVHII
eukprot:158894_1